MRRVYGWLFVRFLEGEFWNSLSPMLWRSSCLNPEKSHICWFKLVYRLLIQNQSTIFMANVMQRFTSLLLLSKYLNHQEVRCQNLSLTFVERHGNPDRQPRLLLIQAVVRPGCWQAAPGTSASSCWPIWILVPRPQWPSCYVKNCFLSDSLCMIRTAETD